MINEKRKTGLRHQYILFVVVSFSFLVGAMICQHLPATLIPAHGYVCDECVKVGSQWVHLRTCQTCGAVLCCDNSPKKHMTAHYHATHHPVVTSAEPGENWAWCYPDRLFMELA